MADKVTAPAGVKKASPEKIGRGIRAVLASLKEAKGTWFDGTSDGKVNKEAGTRTIETLRYLAKKVDEIADDAGVFVK